MFKQKFVILLGLCAGFAHAGVIETISINLSPLHPGSILSGSVVLQNPLAVGSSVVVPLTFSDPSDYSFTTLSTTLSVVSGMPKDQYRFSNLTFVDLVSAYNPALNNKSYTLSVSGAATCAVSFPCQATGGFEANSPAAFRGTYTVMSTESSAPEPASGVLVAGLLSAVALALRFKR